MSRQARLVAAVIALALLVGLLWWQGRPQEPTAQSSQTQSSQTQSFQTQTRATQARPTDGLDTISLADLPREARQVHELLLSGGPFPHSKDGSVFLNRERRLPRMPSGYYREFTVPTPGEDDRGPRRLVVGGCGKQLSDRRGRVRTTPCAASNPVYWTEDHYETFRRVR